jgi:hypothetical protein
VFCVSFLRINFFFFFFFVLVVNIFVLKIENRRQRAENSRELTFKIEFKVKCKRKFHRVQKLEAIGQIGCQT